MSDERKAYVGRCRGCNQVVAATIDEPRHAKEVARELSRWVKDGMIIERVEVDYVRTHFSHCVCQDAPTSGGKSRNG